MHEAHPASHLTAPTGWINDPNGLFFVDGRLHVTYQLEPDRPEWGTMHWGHAASADLLHWQHLPVALAPDPDGPDSFGCWSGCIVELGHEARLFYTAVRLEGDVRRARVAMATSGDPGRVRWDKHAAGPIIDSPPDGIAPELFRDPFVWAEGDEWRMIVGGGMDDGRAAVLLYASSDLDRWRSLGPILTSDQVTHIPDAQAPMWECPQLLRQGDDDVLIVSVVDPSPAIRPSHVTAFVGRFSDRGFDVRRGQRLGMGPDFYAPAVTRAPDGRWLLFGWIPEDPPMAGSERHWAGALTFPRVVSVGDDEVSLALADEVRAGRRDGATLGSRSLAAGEAPVVPSLPTGAFEVGVDIRPGPGSVTRVSVDDGSPADPLGVILYHEAEQQLTIARRGIVGVAGRSSMSAATLHPDERGVVRIRVLVDGSILELEANGSIMGTIRLAPYAPEARHIAIGVDQGQVVLEDLSVWSLG